MSAENHNGHHDLMSQMDHFAGTREESDYLSQVDELSGGPEAPGLELPVGQRVKAIREQKGLSLIDLAQRTGLPSADLAEIEKGELNPPLGILVKLGKALEMKLGTLIASGEERPYAVVRKQDRQNMSRYPHSRETSYGYSYQALAPHMRERSMEPFMVTLKRTGTDVAPSSHDGEEFIFVLDGELEALVGDARELLGPGDSIYYKSSEPHLLRPAGEGPTQVVAVIFSPER